MTLRVVLFLTLISLMPSAAVAAIRCEEKLSRVEKIICQTPNHDSSLLELDHTLNAAYSATLAVVEDKATLRKSELIWLQSRDSCDDFTCVYQLMLARISELARERIKAQPPLAAPLDSDGVKAACTQLGEQISRRALPAFGVPSEDGRTYMLTLKHGGSPVLFGDVRGGGSCSPREIAPLFPDGTPHESTALNDALNDDADQLPFGSYDELIYFGRRYFLVTSRFYDRHSPVAVQWISPEGHLHPICELKAAGIEEAAVPPPAATALCKAQVAGKLQSIHWKPAALPESITDEVAPGAPTVSVFESDVADVDLMADGATEKVARVDYGDGAGCGHGARTLVALSKTANALSKDIAAQRLESIDFTEDSDIVIAGNRAYIVGILQEPESAPGLVDIAQDPPQEVCRFRTHYEVTRIFPLLDEDGNPIK